MKFWPSCAPGKGIVVGRKFLAPPYYSQCAVFASLRALFSFVLCLLSSDFVIFTKARLCSACFYLMHVCHFFWNCQQKVKVHTLDIAPLRSESPLQKCSGMAHVLKRFRSFTCTPTRSSAIGMIHTCLCLPSRSWYSFTDPGGMEG